MCKVFLREQVQEGGNMTSIGFAPVNQPRPTIGCDVDGFVTKPKSPVIFGIPVGCDLPEQGGIGGNIGRKMPKPPVVCYLA